MTKQNYPRVLIISHNPFDLNLSIGKTLTSLFKGWPKDSIAQLYLHNQVPDSSVCSNFFHITEEQLLFKKKEEVGVIVNADSKEVSEGQDVAIRNYVKEMELFSLGRNILWSFRKWSNSNLYEWIEKFSPEVIFFAAGGSCFSYDIVNTISKKYSLPVYLYYMDDFILPRKTMNFLWWINWLSLHRSLKEILPRVEKVFTIGKDMSLEYQSRIGKECIEIMNSVDVDEFIRTPSEKGNSNGKTIRMAYFGGLHLNRWKTLSKLGETIKKTSVDGDLSISLDIYTNQTPERKVLELINQPPYIQYKGSVSSDEIIIEMKKYDLLVHIESFEKKYTNKTKLSISTKIPEYLATGRPILAVGPRDISSIKYIKEIGSNYVIDTLDELKIEEKLLQIKMEKDKHEKYGNKNVLTARDYHSSELNREIVRKSLYESVVEDRLRIEGR